MRIAIVGCGVGGMGAALAMARDGHDVTLFEKFPVPRPLGAGLLLQPSGLEALAALDLREAVEERGARVDALRGTTPRGRPVLDLVYERWAPGAHGVGIHRSALFDVLHQSLSASATRLVAGAEIVRVETPARPVLIDAEERCYGPFDLAIIADGAASALRALVEPGARAPLYPWGAIWTIRPDPDRRWAGVLAQMYAGARVMIGVLPVSAAPEPARVALFWSLREDDHGAWRAAGPDAWRAAVGRYWPAAGALLEGDLDFASLAFARYHHVRAWPWGRGAALLLGDAAHATSPQLGQGANLALTDAVALAAALRRDFPLAALGAYRRQRRAKVAWVQILSAALTPVFQSRSAIIGAARDIFMPVFARLWPLNRMMLATLTGAGALPLAHLMWRAPRGPRRVGPDR